MALQMQIKLGVLLAIRLSDVGKVLVDRVEEIDIILYFRVAMGDQLETEEKEEGHHKAHLQVTEACLLWELEDERAQLELSL